MHVPWWTEEQSETSTDGRSVNCLQFDHINTVSVSERKVSYEFFPRVRTLESTTNMCKAPSLISLLVARGEGRFLSADEALTEYGDQWICESHFDELIKQWDRNGFSHFRRNGDQVFCSIPSCSRKGTTTLQFHQARDLLQCDNILLHPGASECF